MILYNWTHLWLQVLNVCHHKRFLWSPFYAEAQLIKIRNYFCYIPDNDKKVDILVWNSSDENDSDKEGKKSVLEGDENSNNDSSSPVYVEI